MAYRKAKCIELHDVNTVITTSTEQYKLSSAAGRSVQASRPAFFLRWADVALLARRFGLTLSGAVASLGQVENEATADLPVFRTYYETPANTPGVSIINLECDVQGPNLVEIRIVSRLDSAASETPDEVEIITHSGSFTIWWTAERSVDALTMMAVAEAHPLIPVEGEAETGPVITTSIDLDLEIPDGGEETPN